MGELEGTNVPGDPSRMRISDADRHRVAEVLREAAGEGRLDLDELDERLEMTFEAKTYADLVPITADLHVVQPAPPTASPAPRAGGVPAVGHASSIAIMGDCKRRGVWQVPVNHAAFALMGSITLDLREALLAGPEVTINASAIMGDVKILIPAHVHAVVDGTPIMGDYGQGKDKVAADLGPASPTVRVRGLALMGSVQVVRLPPPGTPRKMLGHY
ncbi:DUF1707 SHOCT-like domain-containing protein [Nocardioides sp. Soil805]|uniref:DUF1707 SHOCT-like domain-containing protein n=1 Tax=Nocardioides sp. Soil805 TaxID=1736416 RepID=UPI0007026FEC|nr:DUF1707 domain-containing protein [Nocardioides sp. Soil805]KRF36760.1 hypothetical protein ASG94_04930 [Nocardioides sp. Soil805]